MQSMIAFLWMMNALVLSLQLIFNLLIHVIGIKWYDVNLAGLVYYMTSVMNTNTNSQDMSTFI